MKQLQLQAGLVVYQSWIRQLQEAVTAPSWSGSQSKLQWKSFIGLQARNPKLKIRPQAGAKCSPSGNSKKTPIPRARIGRPVIVLGVG